LSRDIVEEAAGLVRGSGVSGRHTFYQLKHFVLGKEVTTQAKMWKCIRELEARVGAAKSMLNGIEEAEDDLRILDIRTQVLEKKKSKSALHREYKDIRRRKLERRRSALEESISDMRRRLGETEEEMKFFLGAYRQLESIEPLRPHDDPEANASYWDQNFAQELQLRMMLQRPLDPELVKCILALHEGSSVRRELVGMLDQIQRMAGGAEGPRLDQRGKAIEENIEL
jgi:chromosome segregation ATPase